MANVTIGNSVLTQNHPRIISVVNNEYEVYQAVNGGLKMFTALISERGREEIVTLGNSEDLRDYGALDIKKYGQAAYNAQRWLQSGGQVVARRIMPDDSTFAHAFLNIRSKTAGHDVYLQPLISSIGGATSESTLHYTLETESKTNYDGFKDNLLVELIPTGRGKSYNNMGFRIYANRQYDNFLNYRLYNLEVVEFESNGTVKVAEGPFAVSLFRDALSPVNDESIFIEDVLGRYSKLLKAKVNDENVINLCKEICPNASNPFVVDPIFGETRVINGEYEKINGKDVHDSLIKKAGSSPIQDNTGKYVKRIYSEDNEFEISKIEIEDKSLRETYTYLSEKRPIEMLEFLASIKGSEIGVGYGEDLASDLEAIKQNPTKIIEDTRKLISRCLVGGHDCKALDTHLKTYLDSLLKNDLNKEIKTKGTTRLNSFETLYSSDLKLISNSSFDSKVAFTQYKILDFMSILEDLSIETSSITEYKELEKILITLSDKYTLPATKEKLLKDTLNTDFSQSKSLGKYISDIKTNVIATLGKGIVETVELPGEFNSTYQTAQQGTATTNKEQATRNYDKEILTLLKYRPLFYELTNISNAVRLRDGSDGCFDESNPDRKSKINEYLVNFYNGNIDKLVTSCKLNPFNFIMDANYSIDVKNAIIHLATNIRRDFIFIADCGLNANSKGDLAFRKEFNVSTEFCAIYGQNEIIYDANSGRDIKVTSPYLMASKIPVLDKTVGLQNPIAGTRRGVVEGFKSINYLPTEIEQEDLYNSRINYIVGDGNKYHLGSQLTSGFRRTPLSDLNNVITTLNIKRDAETIVQHYQFEHVDTDVMKAMQQELNLTLNKYVSARAADKVDCSVFSTEYDSLQHIVRVNISVKFKDIIESVVITLEVTR